MAGMVQTTVRSKPSLNGLNMTFGHGDEVVDVLENIDLEVREGEFICLLGPSGCGKSTLLNIVGGFLKPSSGEVVIDGEPVLGADPLRIWRAERKTILFVTHDIEESVQLADRVVVMSTRPARIRNIMEIDIPHPRDISSRRYLDLRDSIFEQIGLAHKI